MEGFFRQYLGALRGVSDKTILAYRDALKLLLCFAADRLGRAVDELTLEHLDDRLIVAFLDHVEKERSAVQNNPQRVILDRDFLAKGRL